MGHDSAEDSLGLRKASAAAVSHRLARTDDAYIVREHYKRYNIPRAL